ncbi:MAG: sugar porter family MFS transporter [Brevibacterium yomogidense]|uniref:sugar porter family MFS transporter n=1 Tax=Brevibacterium sp. Mu109 TaxID=1255669 RepID=UPI000C5B4CCD|nr:sugar porter family MFS transporter [Brevibacterium sp. Mu109]SMX90499.1 MFS transporter, sugar porter (SP) family [Brevibacterium sp. Mu109]
MSSTPAAAPQQSGPPQSGSFVIGRVVHLAVVAALGGFLFGFDTSVINGAVDAMAAEWATPALLTGFMVSSALLGCMAGAALAGRISARMGRVRVMLIAALLFTVSAAGSGLAFGPTDLIVWRIIGGLGVGAASVIAPAYIAEISPASVRGRLGSLQQLAIVLGIFAALMSDAALAGAAGGAAEVLWFGLPAWRWMFLTEVVPAVVYGILALTIPESPRYLVQQGREEEATRVLSEIFVEGVEVRIQEIRRTVVTETTPSFRDILTPSKTNLQPIVWVGIVLSVFQQFVGINVIFYYSTTLWRSVGFTESDALTITVITSVTNIVVTVLAIALIDRIGRRKLLTIGSAGMTVSLGLMTAAFSIGRDPAITDTVMLLPEWDLTALVAANAFVVFFGMSWGPGVWVLLGEMFNNRIRAIALGIAAAAQWLANFLISTTFPSMAEVGLWFAYGFYTIAAFASFLFVWKFVRETNGVELEDMR